MRATPSFRGKLAARAESAALELRPEVADQLERYYALLVKWNAKINLTALPLQGYPDRTLDRLLIEPLQAAALVDQGERVWLDLGSGGGSPAVPFKVVRPLYTLTMVDSTERKCAFLREVVRVLGLTGVEVLTTRIQNLPARKSGCADLITVRAVRLDADLLAIASRLLARGGQLMSFSPGQATAIPVQLRLIAEHELVTGIVHIWERT